MSPNWRDRLGQIAGELRDEAERVGKWAALGSGPDPREIVPYRGYGTATRVLVHGRAVEGRELPPSSATDSPWRNLINTYKRVDSDPLANATVRVTVGGVERDLVANDEGFFREWIDLPAPFPSAEAWQPAKMRLLSPLFRGQPDVRATALTRIPSTTSTFGVISDLDDTVIQSRIANFLEAARAVVLGNARTRLPFPGVAAFYQALERGGDGQRQNPIFYVSSSPWNIYDVIAEFMELQRIPRGPICLQNWELDLSVLTPDRLKSRKEPLIREILDAYPALPFILIGDTTQKDPEIYRAIIDRYPGRILAIYIRNVSPNPERLAAIQALSKEVLAVGSSLILADDSYAAAGHAAEQGWIEAEALESIRYAIGA